MKSNNEEPSMDSDTLNSEQKQLKYPNGLNEMLPVDPDKLLSFDIDFTLQNQTTALKNDLVDIPEEDFVGLKDQSGIFERHHPYTVKESLYFKEEFNEHETELRENIRLITNTDLTDSLN